MPPLPAILVSLLLPAPPLRNTSRREPSAERRARCLARGAVIQTAAQKGYKGVGMEGWTARWYARTRLNEIDDFRQEAKKVAEKLGQEGDLLEVATGPGYFSIELAKLGNFHIAGMDISRTFIEIASQNARRAGVNIIAFRLGNASAMPFPDESFDFVYCSAAFKNLPQPIAAMNEMYRVLRPGGQALIRDLRKDVSLDEIRSYIRQSGRSWFDAWLTKMAFQHMLIKRAYTTDDFERMASQSKFRTCQIQTAPLGLEVHFTKPPAR
jgi:ubiquinone/menaquinone biosynthesis C-methylase UbiE